MYQVDNFFSKKTEKEAMVVWCGGREKNVTFSSFFSRSLSWERKKWKGREYAGIAVLSAHFDKFMVSIILGCAAASSDVVGL